MANEMDGQIEERRRMSAECDSGGAFPGSREWVRANRAAKALAAFDFAHPEVLAEISARHSAEMADGFVARGLD